METQIKEKLEVLRCKLDQIPALQQAEVRYILVSLVDLRQWWPRRGRGSDYIKFVFAGKTQHFISVYSEARFLLSLSKDRALKSRCVHESKHFQFVALVQSSNIFFCFPLNRHPPSHHNIGSNKGSQRIFGTWWVRGTGYFNFLWSWGRRSLFDCWICLSCIPIIWSYWTQNEGGWHPVACVLGRFCILRCHRNIPWFLAILDPILLRLQTCLPTMGDASTNEGCEIPLW